MPDIDSPAFQRPDTSDQASSRRVDWRESAACLAEDPELFFPIGSVGPYFDQLEEARRVCQSCPVQRQCLEFALDIDAQGVWGGHSEAERRSLARRRPRARTVSPAAAVGLLVNEIGGRRRATGRDDSEVPDDLARRRRPSRSRL